MKTSLHTFKKGIQDLQAFLATTEHELELTGILLQRIDTCKDDHIKKLLRDISSAKTDQKRYVYTVVIISLYGILERYIDSIIESFVSSIADSVDSYEMMPDAIKKNHVVFSMDLIKAINDDRHRENTTPKDVIANLHSCLSGNSKFKVNSPAFVLHRGNISLAKIREFLNAIGINGQDRRIISGEAFGKFYSKQDPDRILSAISDREIEPLLEPVNDLVERRNQVSHGVNSLEILSTDLLNELCDFVSAFGSSIFEIFHQEFFKYRINMKCCQKLGKPIAVYNNSIVCFENADCRISVGNILAAETGDALQPFRYGPIESLQIDKEKKSEIIITEPTKFGVKVLFGAKNQFNYYVFPAEIL